MAFPKNSAEGMTMRDATDGALAKRDRKTSLVRLIQFLAIGSAVLSGCCFPIPARSGTTYHLIVGIGVVAVSDPAKNAVVATDAHSLGVAVSDRPGLRFAFGYSSSSVVSVADGARDVRVEVSRKPGGPLIVDAPSAESAAPVETTVLPTTKLRRAH
jgi:hypothetical protein